MTRSTRLGQLGIAVVLATVGCRSDAPSQHADASTPSVSAVPSSQGPEPASPLQRLLAAEAARTADLVRDDDVASGELATRRQAARALARSEDPRARERLEALLADADPDVLSWAAFGLAQVCAADREGITQRLVLRGASHRAEPPAPIRGLDPSWALPRALGKCGYPVGERTLVAWLAGPRERARAAALGLGDVAARQRRLEEETAAALLRAATGDAAQQALPEAFYPFAQLKQAPPRARDLLLARAQARLAVGSSARIFAIRSLAPLGVEAVADLRKVVSSPSAFTPEERAEAARALGKIGVEEARAALVAAIDELAPPTDPVGLTTLASPGFGPLWTAIDTLGGMAATGSTTSKGLAALSTLPVLKDAPVSLQRRVTMLRCAAARVVAGKDPDAKVLTGCDPDPKGVTGAMARIAVLGAGPLRGPRLASWRSFVTGDFHAKVREAALELVGTHSEIDGLASVLASALRAKEPGVVATAAEQIASHPDRVFVESRKPGSKAPAEAQLEPEVAKALKEAVGRQYPDDAVETTAQLALAAGAVRLEDGRTWLEELCTSPNVTLRAAAQTALSSVARKKATCSAQGAKQAELPSELGQLERGLVQLTLATDAGELKMTLDPELAPVAVTRIAGLARKGFYDGVAVHRVVAGFVVQFGDPGGDGYGGDGRAPLRCELSPVPFDALSVGIATAGRDTGSSQLFVTLAPEPHLDGQYTWLGKAEGPWNALAPGDVVQRVTVSSSPR